MKSKIFIVLALFLSLVVSLCVRSNEMDTMENLFKANIEALASIEDPIALCDRYCYDRIGYVCVLTTIYGFDINCIDMYPH